MSTSHFDKKFGVEWIQGVPRQPGVYLVYGTEDALVYVGKANNLFSRLSQYRHAGRKKTHRKMRLIIKQAQKITWRICKDEKDALLVENALIQAEQPLLNLNGARYFIYPSIGFKLEKSNFSCCVTSSPEKMQDQGFTMFGSYRSRKNVWESWGALSDILDMLGHKEPSSRRGYEQVAWTRGGTWRRLPVNIFEHFESFLRGESDRFLETLILQLLVKPGARAKSKIVQEKIVLLRRFFRKEAISLRLTLLKLNRNESWVSQVDRDKLFILAANP